MSYLCILLSRVATPKSQQMYEMDKFSSSETWGVDSSYHVRINVGVRRDSVWGISVHNLR